MKLRSLVSSFVNRFVFDTENKSKDIYNWGEKNTLPNMLIATIADSGVATRAVGKVAEYIASDGFVETSAATFKVNDKETADQLLQTIAGQLAISTGFALHIQRKGGKVSSVKSIPIQCVRKKITGGFFYNPTYGQKAFDEKKTVHYPEFVERDLTNEELQGGRYANGELMFVYRKTPFNSYYPIPDYYSQIEDVQTSSEIAKFDLETVVNGFLTSAIITMIGDIDDQTKDTYGKTELDYIHEDFKGFTGQIKNSDGVGGRNKAMLTFAATKEGAPVVQQFDSKSILEASNSKRDVIERAVCRLFGMHPVLLGYSDAAVLGNTQALANASLEANKVVNPLQRLITDAFKKIWPTMDWTISEYMPIAYIDPALFDKMTEDEIRNKLLGLPPKETDATGEGDKIVKALNSLSTLVANKVLESLTGDEIRQLIGLGAKVIDPNKPDPNAVN
jgi:hypothetical protein